MTRPRAGAPAGQGGPPGPGGPIGENGPIPIQADFAIIVCFEDASRKRFLVARHRDRGWELPGGRVELHENPLEGAVREFGEETGHRLRHAQLVLRHPTDHGVCWVVTGLFGDAVEGHVPADDEAIVEVQFVASLSEVQPLAFPEDPYAEIEAALGVSIR